MKEIAPSILSADFCKLGEQIEILKNLGMEFVHIDVMDGHFVPNLTIGPLVCNSIKKHFPDLKLDVHLMIEHPMRYIDAFAESNPYIIYFHLEAEKHVDRLINYIKSKGINAGVSINPATPVSLLEHILPIVDSVLVMSVNPGFGGQRFIPYTLKKIKLLDNIRKAQGYNYFIAVDGGVNTENIKDISKNGCNLFVAGSSVFKGDIAENFKNLNKIIKG